MLDPKIRKDLSDRARYMAKLMGKNYMQLEASDHVVFAQLLDMANAWFPPPPNTWRLFEQAPEGNTYPFYYTVSTDLSRVTKSFLRACINITSYSGAGTACVHSVRSGDSVVVWAGAYEYAIILTAYPTVEQDVYEIVCNVYEDNERSY